MIPMPPGHFEHRLQVGFRDTDASGWMHFPNVFCYVEEAECTWLRQLGVLAYDRAQGGWPRVKVDCQYRHPLVAWDWIVVRLRLLHLGNSSLRWGFEVRREEDAQVCAAGTIVTVRVDATGTKIAIPTTEREVLNRIVAPISEEESA